MSLSRRQRKQRAVYRWAVLALLAVIALSLAFPVQVLVAREGAASRRLLSSQNCRAMLGQAVPLLGAHLETGGVAPSGEAGVTGVTGEAGGADGEGGVRGIVGWLFGLATGVSLGEPASFLTANLPLARSPYAGEIMASGRELASSARPASTTSGGAAGYPPSGGGLSPGAPSGQATATIPGSGAATGTPADGVIEDQDAQLYLYGGGDPIIAIVHTHGSESFLPAVEALALAKDPKADSSSLEAFTSDSAANMLRVGEEIARYLATAHGIPVVQSRRLHDAQVDGFRLGAYERSLETMTEILRRHPTVKIMIDLHRDAPARDVTTAVIKGVSTATICVIVGTDRLLDNPRWQANYDFARRLVATMEQNYPGLSRGILVRDERYNQHVMDRTILLEVGGQENTLEEVFAAVHDLGDVLSQIVAEGFD